MPAPRLTKRQLAALRGGGWAPTAPKRVRRPVQLVAPSIEVAVPYHARSESNRRDHWSRGRWRRSNEAGAAWAVVVRVFGLSPASIPLPCRVTLTRLGGRKLDAHDNLPASMKFLVDAIAYWIGLDDGDPRLTWCYAQEPSSGPCGVRVRLECQHG